VGRPGFGDGGIFALTAASEELAAYNDGAAWASGPQPVYGRLAAAALARLPHRLDGRRALDVGAGTGAATLELLQRGCEVVAVDMSTSMLAALSHQTGGQVPTLVGDIRNLPIPDSEYDVTVAAFVVNHLADPAGGVRELARVTRRGGQIIATTFGADDHPMKDAIDDVLVRYGFEHPSWYLLIKRERMPLIANADALGSVGVKAGLADISVEEIKVNLADLPIEATIAYRLGLAHIVPFVMALDARTRERLDDELFATVSELPPFWLPMLVLSGRS
jgi:ubiquinone/menaquinone biosynthesis C-methylase UbiE